jgi:hypothetical protein
MLCENVNTPLDEIAQLKKLWKRMLFPLHKAGHAALSLPAQSELDPFV